MTTKNLNDPLSPLILYNTENKKCDLSGCQLLVQCIPGTLIAVTGVMFSVTVLTTRPELTTFTSHIQSFLLRRRISS